MSKAPTPARLRLPRLTPPPATILEFLSAHFPQIAPEVWQARVAAGKVRLIHDDTTDEIVSSATPYKPGSTVFYFREVADEPAIPFPETVIYEDDRLLVVDKPHFLPVTPAGAVVNECLLFRLQSRTGLADLAPVHRLDRDTAGLVLFVKHKADRAAYTQLFAEGNVERQYRAIAKLPALLPGTREWQIETRIEPEPGTFRMHNVSGETNARTRIVLTDIHPDIQQSLGRFELSPSTGKKHQLRLHMMSIGFPILDDPFYPQLQPRIPGDFSRPMRLLAMGLRLTDPFTQQPLSFRTQRALDF